jgi:CBS domain-containing protein
MSDITDVATFIVGPVEEVSRTAAEAMVTTPARHPLSATVGEIRDFFRDDHVHAALIVSPAGYLEAVVERDDIAGCQALDAAAAPLGRLAGRTVTAGASLAEVRQAMTATGRRRAAVTSADGRLLGLLCLKASRAGFCSDQDVRARGLGEADLMEGRGPHRGPAHHFLSRAQPRP